MPRLASATYQLNVAPTVAVTYPVTGTTYGTNWSGTITGSASSNVTGATISGDKVALENTTTSKWWNGSSFGGSSAALRRSHGDDELEPELRREQPGLERQLLGGGPGHRLGRQGGTNTATTLHLHHGASSAAVAYPVNATTYGQPTGAGA